MNETTSKTTSKKMIVRTTAAVLVAGVATMLAAGSASAATPRMAPHAPVAAARLTGGLVGFRSIELVNMTPYEWTLDPASRYVDPDSGNTFHAADWPVTGEGPTQTLEPGQREDITTQYNNGKYGVMWVNYAFTDAAGGQHMEIFQTPPSPDQWGENVKLCAADGNEASAGPSTTFNTVPYNLDSDPMTIAAGMDGPTAVTVDAAKEPARAAAIMQQFADGADKSYTPTQAVQFTPITAATAPDQVTGEFTNDTSEKAVIRLDHSVETTEDTTLSAEIGADAQFSILGLVNADANVSVQTGKTFGTQSTTDASTSITLLPAGQSDAKTGEKDSGWITRKTQNASVTGDFDFTTAGGLIVYHVKNVTVDAQAIADPNNTTTYPVVYGQQWATETPAIPGN